MRKELELFEFLAELIDIQIKKYVALTEIGVGPDAALNARLVHDQVDGLFNLAERLLRLVEKPDDSNEFASIFNHIAFDVMQEHTRAYAGWLIDSNKVHNAAYHRVGEQITWLLKFSNLYLLNLIMEDPELPDISQRQMQNQHDSKAIAFLILDMAVKLREDKAAPLSDDLPAHAKRIMRSHVANANSRYFNETIWRQIESLHTICKKFLDNSLLQKSSAILTRSEAIQSSSIHSARFAQLLSELKRIQVNSILFYRGHEWYDVAKLRSHADQSTSYAGTFFRKTCLVGGLAIMAGFAYFMLASQGESVNLKRI